MIAFFKRYGKVQRISATEAGIMIIERGSDRVIQYKSGRLYIPGISFPVPEGFYLYTDVDSVADNYLQFISPDYQYRLSFQAVDSLSSDVQKDLELIIRETGGQVFTAPSPLSTNNLKGYYAIYGHEGEVYYELRIKSPCEKDGYKQLILLMMCDGYKTIQSIINTPAFKTIINGIRPEETV